MTNLQKEIFEHADQGLTGKEIAEKLDVSVSTVRRVIANKELREQYDSLKVLQVDPIENFKEIIPLAVVEIKSIIQDPLVRPSIKLNASKQLIELCKYAEALFPPPPQEHVVRVIYGKPDEGEELGDYY
ncbi:MAG: helix-turn-helix domain-containing protein [Defluviitaleaceae bacterium]|nr:helix-turn-helix domain-containing protein [Defluviitaleaceae bacterium]